MRVTIADIARQLNLANSTVSRALKDDPRISTEVREQVKELARQLGYRPNLVARSLVSERTFSIGLVINDITWSFFGELAQHIQNAAESYQYATLIYSSGNNPHKERIGIESLVARRSDGLIVSAHENMENIHLLEQLSREGCPVILLNNIPAVSLDIVGVDNVNGNRSAMQYLADLGHRRIAYIGPEPVKSFEVERLAGYEQFCRQFQCGEELRMVFTGEASPLLGYKATLSLLENNHTPTAVLAYNDIIALGVIRAVWESGLRVPDDISVVGADGLALCLTAYPPLTTVAVPIREMAVKAVELLMQRIQANESIGRTTPARIQLLPELIIRQSVSVPRS